MKEILGGDLEIAFKELNINATRTYEGDTHLDEKTQVWEISDKDFEKISRIPNNDWKNYWGWWRYAVGSNMCNIMSIFNINHYYIKAWDGNGRLELIEENKIVKPYNRYWNERKFRTLLNYFCDELGVSTKRNICALAVDLASINGISMGKLFRKYQE